MSTQKTVFASRISEATSAVFGESVLTQAVNDACNRYERDLDNIQTGRGINALLIAIVGAKGQGKTWTARQFIRDPKIQSLLRSGDLIDDATTRLVWIGPVAPDGLDPGSEIYHPCQVSDLAQIGQPYVVLDTPGLTDANQRAATLAEEALSLAPIKILVVARDQLRAAANIELAKQIDGSICVPVISSVEPDEMPGNADATGLAEDLRTLRDQLAMMAPKTQLQREILVPDFEITGDEEASSQVFVGQFLDQMSELGLTDLALESARDHRVSAAGNRLRSEVSKLIGDEIPQLASAVEQLNRETEHLPERVLDSLLGSESVLETGVRMRLRARLVGDTSLLWFPYRTLMSTLNLTQGAWDRVMLAMTGSVPSLFGALTSWARNVRQNQEFTTEIQEGIRQRTQQQVEERLKPLCKQFHRTVMKLRPRAERSRDEVDASGMHLSGIEELQTRSQKIFESAINQHATKGWVLQVYAILGMLIFWSFMSGPIILIYKEYLMASVNVVLGRESHLSEFPHPTPGLLFTSVILSTLPLAVYCMVILTWALSEKKVKRVSSQIVDEHETTINELKQSNVIRLEFEDQLLGQAEYLLNLAKEDR